jgi:hypothetical protein
MEVDSTGVVEVDNRWFCLCGHAGGGSALVKHGPIRRHIYFEPHTFCRPALLISH